MDAAKLALAPDTPLSAWLYQDGDDDRIRILPIALDEKNHTNNSAMTVRLCRGPAGASNGTADCNTSSNNSKSSISFVDNCQRRPGSDFDDDTKGDTLPLEPVVLTGCCVHWRAFGGTDDSISDDVDSDAIDEDGDCEDGVSTTATAAATATDCTNSTTDTSTSTCWTVETLRRRLSKNTRLSLDGGPWFARESLRCSRVSMADYAEYCGISRHDSDATRTTRTVAAATLDCAPLYLFDPDVLQTHFCQDENDHTHHRRRLDADYTLPSCLSYDTLAGLTGSRFRPLPPAWLLVGVVRSGTPLHDHPLCTAWNALTSGRKLWCCLPPDCPEDHLIVPQQRQDARQHTGDGGAAVPTVIESTTESMDDDEYELDASALEWFANCGITDNNSNNLPDSAIVILQQPGEIVCVPPGWWHVVLNIETSTAICGTLTLRRDVPHLFGPLYRSDPDFGQAWLDSLLMQQEQQQAWGGDMDPAVLDALRVEVLAAAGARMTLNTTPT